MKLFKLFSILVITIMLVSCKQASVISNVTDTNDDVIFNKLKNKKLLDLREILEKDKSLLTVKYEGMNIVQYFVAERNCEPKVLDLLIELGAENSQMSADLSETTKLGMSIFSDNYDCAEYLIENGEDIHIINNVGFSNLHFAVAANNLSLVKLLMSKKININQKTIDGYTALDLAKTERDYYLNNGTKIEIENNIKIIEYIRTVKN